VSKYLGENESNSPLKATTNSFTIFHLLGVCNTTITSSCTFVNYPAKNFLNISFYPMLDRLDFLTEVVYYKFVASATLK
jgi:hypothetical protein